MGKFKVENDFATAFGTTTSDGFHADSDAIRYEPDVYKEDENYEKEGKSKDGSHASVETALKKRVQTITLNNNTYSADTKTGNVNLGEIVTDLSTTISGITIQSGDVVGVQVKNRKATISLNPSKLVYNTKNGDLTLVDEFGVSGNVVSLGKDKFVESGSYDETKRQITLVFNDTTSITIDVADLMKYYRGDEETITYVQGTTSAFTLTQSVKDTLNEVSVISGDVVSIENLLNEIEENYISGIYVNNSAITVTDKVASITLPEGRLYDADEVTIAKNPISGSEHPNEWFSIIALTDDELLEMMKRVGLVQDKIIRMFYTSTESADTSYALGLEGNKVIQ